MLVALEVIRQKLPEFAKDVKLSLESVLSDSSLSTDQRWGVAVASAIACENAELRTATLADAVKVTSAQLIEDASAAAVLMAMTNIYYRFRHMSGKASYATKPPRLRMNRLGHPHTGKMNGELFALAVSAIHGCEVCVQAHEKSIIDGGLTEDNVNDTIRIAAVFHGVSAALQAS